MEYKTEISEYRKFCKKYYPKHYSLRFVDNNRSDLLKMFQIINLFEILKDYDVATNEQLIPLCKMILVTLFDLLLAIPAIDRKDCDDTDDKFNEKILRELKICYKGKIVVLEKYYNDDWEIRDKHFLKTKEFREIVEILSIVMKHLSKIEFI